ncbi:MAG: amidohydrolase family protein [Xenophilus sp.]
MSGPTQATGPAIAGPVDLLMRGASVVTMDDVGTVIDDGVVAVQGARITWVGARADWDALGIAAASVIDGTGRIALPGMIDAHFHTGQQLLRGKLVQMGRTRALRNPPWKNYFLPFEGLLTPEDVHLSGLVAYANMLMVGTTCFAEAGGPHPDEMARAALDVGVRGFVALSTADQNTDFAGASVPGSMMLSTEQALERNVALVRRWSAQDRVRATLSLRQIIVCSPPLIEAIGHAARELDAKIHTHLGEGTYEVDYALERFGKRPTEYLEDLGVLSHHLHCAHSVILSPGEVDLYARYRVTACHCALGNFGIGRPRLQEMWRRGIAIGMGSDGASGGTIDLFRIAHGARVGLQASEGHPYHSRQPMGGEDLLRIVTRGGARALGMEAEIGSLEAGKRADLILVDPGDFDQFGARDALYTAANTVVGRDVRTVVVNGQVVMKERELQRVDAEEIRARLAARLPEIMRRFEAAV